MICTEEAEGGNGSERESERREKVTAKYTNRNRDTQTRREMIRNEKDAQKGVICTHRFNKRLDIKRNVRQIGPYKGKAITQSGYTK